MIYVGANLKIRLHVSFAATQKFVDGNKNISLNGLFFIYEIRTPIKSLDMKSSLQKSRYPMSRVNRTELDQSQLSCLQSLSEGSETTHVDILIWKVIFSACLI